MAYIEDSCKEPGGCFLCDLSHEPPGPNNLLLHLGETCLVVMNRFPYNPGHLLVAPLRHAGAPGDLTRSESAELWTLQVRALRLLERVMTPQGFNLGFNLGKVAGAGLPGHLHLHIVPRWNGDCNFMPLLGQTKVIPQALEGTYTLLRQAWTSPEESA